MCKVLARLTLISRCVRFWPGLVLFRASFIMQEMDEWALVEAFFCSNGVILVLWLAQQFEQKLPRGGVGWGGVGWGYPWGRGWGLSSVGADPTVIFVTTTCVCHDKRVFCHNNMCLS